MVNKEVVTDNSYRSTLFINWINLMLEDEIEISKENVDEIFSSLSKFNLNVEGFNNYVESRNSHLCLPECLDAVISKAIDFDYNIYEIEVDIYYKNEINESIKIFSYGQSLEQAADVVNVFDCGVHNKPTLFLANEDIKRYYSYGIDHGLDMRA